MSHMLYVVWNSGAAMFAQILFVFLFSRADAFDLEPAVASPVIVHHTNFTIDHTSSVVDLVRQNIRFDQVGESFVVQIAKEIDLAIGINDTKIHHMRWITEINSDIGKIIIVSISADIRDANVHFTLKHLAIVQPIPEVFDVVTQCAKSGKRKTNLGFFRVGPRKEVCNTHHVKRGLNNDELDLVKQNLMQAARQVQVKLIG